MVKRRQRMEQVHDVLQVCIQPKRFTYILRGANMETAPLQEILPMLEERGYVVKSEVRKHPRSFNRNPRYTWETTASGQQLMREIKSLMDKITIRVE